MKIIKHVIEPNIILTGASNNEDFVCTVGKNIAGALFHLQCHSASLTRDCHIAAE